MTSNNSTGVQDNNYNFAANEGQGSPTKYMGATASSNQMRAKTMAPSVGFQML